MSEADDPVVPEHERASRGRRNAGHDANIFRCMRHAILGALLLIASCHSRRGRDEAGRVDTTDVARMFPLHPHSTDSLLRTPRVISDAAGGFFLLRAAGHPRADQSPAAVDHHRYYTA